MLVWCTEGTLLLELTRGTSGGTPVYATVRLYYSGTDSAAGLTVTVTRQAGGLMTPPVAHPGRERRCEVGRLAARR